MPTPTRHPDPHASPQDGNAHAAQLAHLGEEIEQVDRALARGARRVTAPLRHLVNAPHLLVTAILAVWVGCSLTYAYLEDKGPIEGLWWGIVTGSTVGYGDFYPSSTAGRGVGAVLIVCMVVLLPIAIGHVIANLVLDRNQFTHDEQVALAHAVDCISDRVDTLQALVLADLTARHGAAWVKTHLATAEVHDAATVDRSEHMLKLLSTPED